MRYADLSTCRADLYRRRALPDPQKGPARLRVPRLRLCGGRSAGGSTASGPAGAGLAGYLGCLVRVLGIALAAQFAADTCREAGMAAAATAAELGGRILALLQALPLLQELLDCFAGYLQ